MMLVATLSYLLGGTGLFLVGMILMSDGLRAAAGGGLQRILERSTRTPVAGFFSGVGLTALVQSSSATTLATIGFVSAGLLTFSSAIGVIIGANVGTTSTGWIVSMLGFKVDVASMALPLIGVGALTRLLSGGRKAQLGMALVGFGLIFVGIEFLQEGMAGLTERIDLSRFTAASIGGRATLVLIGAIMTVLLQSSSAAVAVTLTALYSGAIDLHQSAYLVIGQNLGTTVTAALAAIGASVPARRTAVVHILFNTAAAMLAFVFAEVLLDLVRAVAGATGRADLAVQIALFHTVFNVTGALIVLPFTRPFARIVTRLVPDRGPQLTRNLDKSLLTVPTVAVEASSRAMRRTAAVTFDVVRRLLVGSRLEAQDRDHIHAAREACDTIASFLADVDAGREAGDLVGRRLSLFHAGDHVARLTEACEKRAAELYGEEARHAAERLVPHIDAAMGRLQEDREGDAAEIRGAEEIVAGMKTASRKLAALRRRHRADLLERTAAGHLRPEEAQRRLDSMRWVDRVGYHAWRALHHLANIEPLQGDVHDRAVHEAAGERARPGSP